MRKPIALAVAIALWSAGIAEAKTFEVTRKGDPAPGKCKRNDCSLREAVLKANARAGKDEIVLTEKGRYKLTRANPGDVPEDAGMTGDLDINNNPLAIVHPGKGKAKIDNDVAGDRVLHIQDGAATRLRKIVVTGGDLIDSTDGGGINTSANLKLTRSAVVNNSTADDGGGVDLNAAAGLTMKRSVVSGNDADDIGAGVNTSGEGSTLITASRISGNTAGDGGGGLDLDDDPLVRMVRSTVAGNRSTTDNGGGIDVGSATRLVIKQSTFVGNRAEDNGGAIYSVSGGTIAIKASTVNGNHANGPNSNGGGLYADGPAVSITNSTFDGNSASDRGGAIHAQDGADLSLNAVTVTRNRAAADDEGFVLVGGGGLSRISSVGFDVRNSLIALNKIGAPGDPVSGPNDCAADTEFDSLGNNLLSTPVKGANCEGFDGPNDLVRSNPKIAKLRKNGGPTKTVALKKGSAAIGHAHKPSAPNRDQRGEKRKDPDSGAFERTG